MSEELLALNELPSIEVEDSLDHLTYDMPSISVSSHLVDSTVECLIHSFGLFFHMIVYSIPDSDEVPQAATADAKASFMSVDDETELFAICFVELPGVGKGIGHSKSGIEIDYRVKVIQQLRLNVTYK